MNRAPAFQFYPKDWLDFRVQRMSLAAQGAYLKLLCFMWADSKDQCSIQDDNSLLSRGLGTAVEQWLELRKEIQCESDPIFEQKSGCLVSARLKHESAKQRKYRKSQSEKGKRSAQHRFNHGSTVAEPKHQPERNSSSSLNSYRERKELCGKVEVNGHGPSFEVFWAAYPKKEGKGACRRWWKEHRPDDVLLGLMLAKIDQAKQTPKWKDQGGKFVPMPATWLHQERWDDEYQAAVQRKEPLPL
jgi:uncharacterized protein YdaU (DUF1376 family)